MQNGNLCKRYRYAVRPMGVPVRRNAPDLRGQCLGIGRIEDENHQRSSRENGAGEAIRTPDPNLGKVVLYP